MEQNRYLLKYYYIGIKKFYGSQRQKELLTIEESLLSALKKKGYIKNMKNSECEFASRTDRYVSAHGAAFSFFALKKPILMEINSALPKEIGVWGITRVPNDFLSRFNAIQRHYKYIVFQPLSVLRNQFFIDLNIMKKACKKLQGYHDFKNFSKREKKEIKTIRTIDIVKMEILNDYIIFDFKSKSFLRQQIRRMIKKILELGTHEISFDNFLELFDSSKEFYFQPAEPEGLILWDVKFDDSIKISIDPRSKERMDLFFSSQELKFGLKHQLFNILQYNSNNL